MDRIELENLISKEDKRITVSDARIHFGGCIHGWQDFANAHNFDWKIVVRHGLLSSQLFATNDAMADSLITYMYSKDI